MIGFGRVAPSSLDHRLSGTARRSLIIWDDEEGKAGRVISYAASFIRAARRSLVV